MESGNSTIPSNMTEETSSSSSSSSLKYAKIELIGGVVCMVVGICLAVVSLVFISCTWRKRRRLEREENKAERRSIDLKAYQGRGNPSFEMDHEDDHHVGLPLPSRSPRIFSLSNYNVACRVSAQLQLDQQLHQQQLQCEQQKQQQQQRQQQHRRHGTISPCPSKRQESNSSSDSEVGSVSLHRTSPLAAIYLIYDELNKSPTTSASALAPAIHS